ncbi:MAG: hypothetical protein PHY64_00315 [Eubacteriales bacterium]|nr:hypothetical protein [Eubacteriales bacterium]
MDERQSRLVRKYKNEIVRKMKTLGTYKREHKFVIDVLAGMLADYDTIIRIREDDGGGFSIGDFDASDEDAAEVFLATLEDMKWHE